MKPRTFLLVLAIVLFVIAIAYFNLPKSEQPQQQEPQKQTEEKTFPLEGGHYKIIYTSGNRTIKVNLISIETLGNPSKVQLKNDVEMSPSNILVYTSTDTDDQLIIAYLGSYPNGDAIFKKFNTVEEAQNYVYRKTGWDEVLINVIKVKTGD